VKILKRDLEAAKRSLKRERMDMGDFGGSIQALVASYAVKKRHLE